MRVPKTVVTQPLPIRESSLISELRYDSESGTLDVTLKDKDNEVGGIYRYSNVSLTIVGGLLTAPSLGSAYTRLIKANFKSLKIS